VTDAREQFGNARQGGTSAGGSRYQRNGEDTARVNCRLLVAITSPNPVYGHSYACQYKDKCNDHLYEMESEMTRKKRGWTKKEMEGSGLRSYVNGTVLIL
jgi:hypothetical protein